MGDRTTEKLMQQAQNLHCYQHDPFRRGWYITALFKDFIKAFAFFGFSLVYSKMMCRSRVALSWEPCIQLVSQNGLYIYFHILIY